MSKPQQFYQKMLRLSGPYLRLGVLIGDLFLAAIAFLVACLIVFEFNLSPQGRNIIPALLVLLGFRMVAMLYFRTYASVFQFIGEKDLLRLGYAVLSSSLAYLLLVQLMPEVFPVDRYKAVLFVDLILLILMMGGTRLLMRMGYDFYNSNRSDTQLNTVIYGAGELGAMIERVLRNNRNHAYRVVAFVDDDSRMQGHHLNGIPVYDHNRQFTGLIPRLKIQAAIIAINNISEESRLHFISECLEAGVKVLKIPPSESWIKGNMSLGQLRAINYEDLLNRPPIVLDLERIRESLRDQVILVTGCAGSIGSEIVRQVLKYQPRQVIGLDQSESALADFTLELGDTARFLPVIGDIRDLDRMNAMFREIRPTLVFHAAAYKHVPVMEAYPSEAIKVNVEGTRIMADLASQYEIQKFVMISTDKVVNPGNVMGASKRIAEMYVQSLNFKPGNQTAFITTRFGNVLGSNGSVVPIFRELIEKRQPLTVTHPEITRYFMTIPEACQLVLEAGSLGEGGEIMVFDMGKPVHILDLAKKMIRMAGLIPGQDIPIIFTGLRPGEKLYEELLDKRESLLSTPHPKILRANVRQEAFARISDDVDLLVLMARHVQPRKALIAQIRKMVPEYTPLNSPYSTREDASELEPVPLHQR